MPSQTMLNDQMQKPNQLSKFIFDFYRAPEDDDSFGGEDSTD